VGGDDPHVTPGKKIEFYGRPSKKALIHLAPYVPVPEQTSSEYPLILTTGRVLEQWHTGTITDRIPELANASGRGRAHLHPLDARRLELRTGDLVRLRSHHGSLELPAVVNSALRLGVVWVSFYDAKVLVNRIVADHVDPVSKQPEYKVTAVQAERVG
jgi:nitrate reductase NapA